MWTRQTAYEVHVAERAALGVVPKPISAAQCAELTKLLENPPKGEEDFLLDLITNRVPPGVDEAAYVKADFLTAIVKGLFFLTPPLPRRKQINVCSAFRSRERADNQGYFDCRTAFASMAHPCHTGTGGLLCLPLVRACCILMSGGAWLVWCADKTKSPMINQVHAVQLLGTMQGGYNVGTLIEALENESLAPTAAKVFFWAFCHTDFF